MHTRHESIGPLLGLLVLGLLGCGSDGQTDGARSGSGGTSDTSAIGGGGPGAGGATVGAVGGSAVANPLASGVAASAGGSAVHSGASDGSGGTSLSPDSGGTTSGSGGFVPSTGGAAIGGAVGASATGSTDSGGSTGTAAGGALTPGSGGAAPTGGSVEPASGGSGGPGPGGVGSGATDPVGDGGLGLGTGGGGQAGGDQASGGQDNGGVEASCSIDITTNTLSPIIPTVGIVEWSTDLPGITEAHIEFGLDTSYGMIAPVDLEAANYRTLVLGMKAGGRAYHFRVVARAGSAVCTGPDNTLPPTGDPPNSLPLLTFTPTEADGLDGGFLVFETLKQTFGTGVPDSPVYIVDGDGDFVWWYVDTGIVDVGRARQSYDGKHMWIAAVNVLSQQDRIIRVAMDGSDEQDFTSEFADLNHDFAVREDGTMAFLAYGSNGCDDIKERAPDGTVTTIINSGTAVGATTCHCNALHYDRSDDTIVFSELETSSIVKVSRDNKEVVWVMSSQNAANASISGVVWTNQHGMHLIDERHLLFFNNNTGPNAAAIEVELALNGGTGTATQVWSYASDLTVQILGDVQRLPNGNTLVTFSTAGEIREVDPSGTVLQTIKSVGAGNLFGFSEKRRSLYGPPPR